MIDMTFDESAAKRPGSGPHGQYITRIREYEFTRAAGMTAIVYCERDPLALAECFAFNPNGFGGGGTPELNAWYHAHKHLQSGAETVAEVAVLRHRESLGWSRLMPHAAVITAEQVTVLVAGDTAYALAGRTTEADGGLYVLAMDPATGAAVWPAATRLYQHNPGDLRALPTMKNTSWNQWTATYDPRVNIKTNYVGTADLLGSDGEVLQIGCRGCGNIACKTGAASETNCMTSPFGRQIHLGYLAQGSFAPYVPAAFQREKGKYSVRFARGVTISKIKTKDNVYDIRKDGGWKVETPGMCQAVCLAGDRIFAGLSDNAPESPKGELWVLSTDGKKVAAIPLPAAPAYDGIAVANGRVYVTLTDATVMCLGKK